MNVLFIMSDQLRWDHLSCAGHPYLQTANIDALGGVACASRRPCEQWRVRPEPDELLHRPLPHQPRRHLEPRAALRRRDDRASTCAPPGRAGPVAGGQDHVQPDIEGLQRLAIEGADRAGHLLAQGGFREVERYDGHHEMGPGDAYSRFLRARGYDSERPWSDYVISAIDERGQVVSGWQMRNVPHPPARVAEAHSETAYATSQAIDFMRRQGSQPLGVALSYVKPHWPHMAPLALSRALPVRALPAHHQVHRRTGPGPPRRGGLPQHEECLAFARDEVVRKVRPAYQGLIHQL